MSDSDFAPAVEMLLAWYIHAHIWERMFPFKKYRKIATLSLIQTHSKSLVLRVLVNVITLKTDVNTLNGPLNVSTFILSVFHIRTKSNIHSAYGTSFVIFGDVLCLNWTLHFAPPPTFKLMHLFSIYGNTSPHRKADASRTIHSSMSQNKNCLIEYLGINQYRAALALVEDCSDTDSDQMKETIAGRVLCFRSKQVNPTAPWWSLAKH